MSVMVAEIYDALIEAGATEEKARKAASAIKESDQTATKSDLHQLEIRMIKWIVPMLLAQAGLIVALVKLL